MVLFLVLVLVAFVSCVLSMVRAHTLSVRADRLASTAKAALAPDEAHDDHYAVDAVVANDEAVWVKAAESYAARDDNADGWRDVEAVLGDLPPHPDDLAPDPIRDAHFALLIGQFTPRELAVTQRLIERRPNR